MIREAEWRIIPSAPFYVASDDGRIMRSTPGRGARAGRVLRPSLDSHGYLVVGIHHGGGGAKQKTRRISRLVCEAFHGEPPATDSEAAHNDGNPENNTPNNLRWATRLENMGDAVIHGTIRNGESHPCARLSKEDVISIRQRLPKSQVTLRSLAKEFGVSPATIYRASTGQNWRGI